jgi:hypothetical protein
MCLVVYHYSACSSQDFSVPTWGRYAASGPQITGHHVGGWEWCGGWRLSSGRYHERDAGADAKGKTSLWWEICVDFPPHVHA